MNSADAAITIGLCAIIAAGALLVAVAIKARQRPAQDDTHPGSTIDLAMGLLWAGVALTQLGGILSRRVPEGAFNLPLPTLLGSFSAVFLCGVFAGRLLLRTERRMLDRKAAEPGAHAA